MRALGADISVHQSTFTFQGNLDFVVLRASVGTAADARFQQFLPQAMQVPVRGAYHYLTSERPWQDQLALFLSITNGLDLHFLALDFEKINNTRGRLFAAAALSFLEAIDAQAAKPVLFYTNPSTWDEWLVPFVSPDELDRLAQRELWIAQWPFVPDENAARTTRLPLLAGSMRHWSLWQFSGDLETHPDRGAEFGVASDKIDLDVFNGTLAEMQQHFLGRVLPDDRATGRHDDRTFDEPIPHITNQQMINAFFRVGAAFGLAEPFDLVVRAGLTGMATPDSNRTLPYSGPPLGAIPGLSDAERAALRAALAGQPIVTPEPLHDDDQPPD
ncbi:MAG: glycoside hydrolase family 25 protein, partial [Anaerolineales bacterium]